VLFNASELMLVAIVLNTDEIITMTSKIDIEERIFGRSASIKLIIDSKKVNVVISPFVKEEKSPLNSSSGNISFM
jgi:hypothetical protein